VTDDGSPALYVPFLDGVLGYDCVACGAGCCKTGTLGATAQERLYLLGRRPELDAFLDHAHDDRYFAYRKLAPGCWFLRADGWCSIHADDDPRRKPLSCRSHPIYFEPTSPGGPVVAWVSPGCRWRLDEPGRTVGSVTWAEARARHEDNVRAGLYATSLYPLREGLPQWRPHAAGVLAREAVMRDAACRHDELLRYWAWQLALADEGEEPAPAAIARAEEALATLRAAIERVLGVAPPQLGPVGERRLRLLTPMLRAAMLGVGPRPLPYAAGRDALALGLALPRLLTALAVLVAAYVHGTAHGVDYDALLHVLSAWALRVQALAALDHRVLDVTGSEPLEAEDPEAVVALLDGLERDGGRQPLGSVLDALASSWPIAARLRLLDDVGRLLPRLRLAT
jgi:Fe-S-cluster containining protein